MSNSQGKYFMLFPADHWLCDREAEEPLLPLTRWSIPCSSYMCFEKYWIRK